MDGSPINPTRGMCIKCKGGRFLCGAKSCPLLKRLDINNPIEDKLSDTMFGPNAGIFIGWRGYPTVNAGPVAAVSEDTQLLSAPSSWYGLGFEDIIYMRSHLVRGRRDKRVSDKGRFIEDMRELALSVRPTDIEAVYRSKPSFSLSFSNVHQPMGAIGDLKGLKIAQNPVIPARVDKIVSDDLKAQTQLSLLYESNNDVYYLSQVLSAGALGKADAQRMVPTRWSITCVDDVISKHIIKSLRQRPHLNDISCWENEYLGNHFIVLAIPGAWEFELFEAWSGSSVWGSGGTGYEIVSESEPQKGRKAYAFNEGGGYYAARLAVCEALEAAGRQARIVVFREINDTYVLPVGVWEVRENIRVAMKKKPLRFKSIKEAINHVSGRLKADMDSYLSRSDVLTQKRLTDW